MASSFVEARRQPNETDRNKQFLYSISYQEQPESFYYGAVKTAMTFLRTEQIQMSPSLLKFVNLTKSEYQKILARCSSILETGEVKYEYWEKEGQITALQLPTVPEQVNGMV